MKKESHSLETKLIHSGEAKPLINGAVTMPIFQSATFQYSGQDNYHDLTYIRLNNTPNHLALNRKLADLENAEAALVTASGMAAISTCLFSLLSPHSHLLVQGGVYGGTHDFIAGELKDYGIAFDFVDGDRPATWKEKLKPETRAIYVESISNPLMHVAALEAVVEFSKKHNLISIIDNTFATPFNFRPAEWDFDLSIHSCTKYLNGHSDIAAGAVIGRRALIEKIRPKLNHFGGTLDPHACFLLQRGIKTLAVRMKQHNESALRIAQYLENHDAIVTVNYPGLTNHPHHERARRLFNGYSGMISFELKGDMQQAEDFLRKLTLPIVAPSLGGVETLISRPAVTSHSGLSPEERRAQGIGDGLIRLSVGIESTDDLIRDLEHALMD